jgi:outer membrane protein, adhesin transport system
LKYLFLVLILSVNLLYCDEVQNKSSYNIDELIGFTINSHPSIRASKQALIASNAGVKSAMWNYFPTPKISAQQTKDNINGVTLSLEQPLWTGGKLSSAMDMAKANRTDSEAALEESAYTLTESLLNALRTYLNAQGNLDALYEGQKQLQILEGMLSRRIAAGVSAKADMDLLKARLYQMETDISLAKIKKQTSLSQIELLTGKRFNGGLQIEASRLNFENNLDNVLKDVLNTHPTLFRYDAKIEYAKAEKKKAKATLWPNLMLVGQKQIGSDSVYYDSHADSTAVYLSLQASPGAGLSSFSEIEASEAKVMQLTQERVAKQQELVEKTMLAYNDYVSALRRVDVQSQSIGSAEKVFASYTRLFLAGKRQWLDLVNASRELTQNEIAFSDIKATLAVSSYQVALLSGNVKELEKLSIDKKNKLRDTSKETQLESLTKIDNNDVYDGPTFDSIMDGNTSKKSEKHGE